MLLSIDIHQLTAALARSGYFFTNMKPSKLILSDGTTFTGLSPDWQKDIFGGEVVFTTGMTGYVETLTDPSYAGQIIAFTYPLIGNYGVPGMKDWEAKKIHANGVVVDWACQNYSHPAGLISLLAWLKEQKIPIITSVDTRALTKILRQFGTKPGLINCAPAITAAKTEFLLKSIVQGNKNLVDRVSIKQTKLYGQGKRKIIVVDCGLKENIIRSLLSFDLAIQRVPYDYDYTNEKFAGLLLSNGPGDPTECQATIKILKKAIKLKKPIFGICLGTQIMALAAGAKTYKLPYGHRGQNQPCLDTETKRCYITSQNHGYAVAEQTLSKDWYVNFKNLNDNSVEGIAHKKLPFFAVQFHPEANPGPTDTAWLFDKFYKLIK